MPKELKERALKITEALYRTTDLFSDAEPLKWSLRGKALEILNAGSENIAKLDKLVDGIFLELELAAGGTFISKANFDVLKKAYAEFLREAISLSDRYRTLLDSLSSGAGTKRISDNVSDLKLEKQPTEQLMGQPKESSKNLTDRKSALLSILQQKGPSSVGELAGAVGGGISEKTVQRELGALVVSGVVKQEGERRWRRYFV